MPEPLRAIFFDIDDTLYSTTEFTHNARRAGARAMIAAGLRMDEAALLAELLRVVDEFSSNDPAHFDKLLRRLPARLLDGLNPRILIAAGTVAYQDVKMRDLTPYEDVAEVLSALSKKPGLMLGVISSGRPDKQCEKLVRLGLHKLLDPTAIFITEDVGFSKSNPAIFKRASEYLGIAPSACLHIGDRRDHDIDPAKAAGFRTVLNLRSGKHKDKTGLTEPDYKIHNFWDLRDILKRDFDIE